MSAVIREATENDLDALEQIENLCFLPAVRSSRRTLRLSIKSPFQTVLVAETPDTADPRIAGSMVLFPHPRTLRIYSIAVHPDSRHRGIGRQLIQHARDLADARGCLRVSLEAEEKDSTLIKWYESLGFTVAKRLPDYYAGGMHGLRLHLDCAGAKDRSTGVRTLIVMDEPGQWDIELDAAEIISAKDYVSDKKYQEMKSVRVFNLCRSYRYQSIGYYVSLLAAARDHRPIPKVATMQDFRSQTIIRSIADDIDDIIQKSLASCSEREATLHIYFGQALDPRYSELGRQIYRLFESPLLKVNFSRGKKWLVQQIVPIPLRSVPPQDAEHIPELARRYFSRKHFRTRALKQYNYDLAILVNPEEKNPPSCPRALKKFRIAAEKLNFYVEFITKEDFNRICEFDALFIRETTAVNHHTYRFARKAYAEGLVVIDDPWSILRCANKLYLNERLLQGRVPVPKTWVLQKESMHRDRLRELSFPMIIKQPDSAFSRGVVKVRNAEEFKTELGRLLKKSDLLIGQEFMPSDFDWRIGVLDRKPFFACKYYMARGHWQIMNWKQEGRHRYGNVDTMPIADVPANVIRTATRAASLIGDGLYGVDLKQIGDKVYVIEINDNPSIDSGIEDMVGKDEIYMTIMHSILREIETARNAPQPQPQPLPPQPPETSI